MGYTKAREARRHQTFRRLHSLFVNLMFDSFALAALRALNESGERRFHFYDADRALLYVSRRKFSINSTVTVTYRLMSNIIDITGRPADAAPPAIVSPTGQPVATDARKAEIASENDQRSSVLEPFPDGALLRYSPNPAKPGTFVLHDKRGTSVALARNEFIADILCKGAWMFFSAVKEQQQAAAAAAEAAAPAVAESLQQQIVTKAVEKMVEGGAK
jgi:hypothetical protein